MALIEIYHVVADMYDVDPDSTTTFEEGEFARLTTSGTNVYATVDNASGNAIGVLADTKSTSAIGAGTPYAANLIVNANGATRSTQNRVSDYFDETVGSGKVTIYNSGGKFATDMYETLDGAAPVSYTVGAVLETSANGRLCPTTFSTHSGQTVARCVDNPKAWTSGVPGTDTTDNSISLGTYITFLLLI